MSGSGVALELARREKAFRAFLLKLGVAHTAPLLLRGGIGDAETLRKALNEDCEWVFKVVNHDRGVNYFEFRVLLESLKE